MSRTFSVGAVLFGAFIMAVGTCLISVFVSEARAEAGAVSQGSVVDPDSKVALAAQKDLAEEERLPDYTQVVDNATEGRFAAPGWRGLSDAESPYEGNYVAAGENAKPARFKVRIPTTNDYSVYAWWPAASANATAARVGVDTVSGKKWGEVDQRTEGGMWIKLGTYDMRRGERYVEVSPDADGRVVADAVAVVRGEGLMPPEYETTAGTTTSRSALEGAKARRAGSGRAVVRAARRHKGDRYRYATCTTTLKSCTCLTKRAVRPFGHRMGLAEQAQWRYDRSVRVSNLRPGDEVFFKENGRRGPITHVGIYSGNGMIVHASAYWGKVVEKEMKYIRGYAGAKRFRL